MPNKIDLQMDKLKNSNKKIGLMTHVVAGYPNIETTIELVKMMEKYGVDFVEIQIPFSDPMADGPTIMKANQEALDSGFRLPDVFKLAKDITSQVNIPILFMTYINIPFVYGIEKFCKESVDAGISGLIVPDIPYDESGENFLEIVKSHGLKAIQVVSPSVTEERLKVIGEIVDGFIYTTLKVGITGAQKEIDLSGASYIDTIKKYTDLPVAAGFGISSKGHVDSISDKADVAVIGSHVINLLNEGGLEVVEDFLNEL